MADEVELHYSDICFDCLNEVIKPVTMECGHTICIPCLRKKSSPPLCCPTCWEFSQLRTLQADIAMHPEGGGVCELHREDQKLFCESDKTLLCVTCSKSEGHEVHLHWPIALAALRYRKKIQAHLEILHENVNKVQELLLKEAEQPLAWAVVQVNQKTNTRPTFQKNRQEMWRYLKRKKEKSKKEKFIVGKGKKKLYELYQRLKEMEAIQEHQIMEEKKEWEAMMYSQSRSLTDIITGLEEKMQKPDVEMLQDVAETLERRLPWPNLEPFILSMDTSYVTTVTEFLQVFQRHKVCEWYDYYDLSEEKKRAIRVFPGFSGKTYMVYITGNVEAETIRQSTFMTMISSLDIIFEEEEFASASTTFGNDI